MSRIEPALKWIDLQSEYESLKARLSSARKDELARLRARFEAAAEGPERDELERDINTLSIVIRLDDIRAETDSLEERDGVTRDDIVEARLLKSLSPDALFSFINHKANT